MRLASRSSCCMCRGGWNLFALIEADRSKAPFAHAAVPSDASAFFLDGGSVCEQEPDLIFCFFFQEICTGKFPSSRSSHITGNLLGELGWVRRWEISCGASNSNLFGLLLRSASNVLLMAPGVLNVFPGALGCSTCKQGAASIKHQPRS